MLQRIRELYWAKPFQPFTIHLADGRAVQVSHPELLAISNSGKTITVYQLDDSMSIINLSMITDIIVPEPAASKN